MPVGPNETWVHERLELWRSKHHQDTLGELLKWQRENEVGEWYRFSEWLARQPPKEAHAVG